MSRVRELLEQMAPHRQPQGEMTAMRLFLKRSA